jgi:hypothetical protein
MVRSDGPRPLGEGGARSYVRALRPELPAGAYEPARSRLVLVPTCLAVIAAAIPRDRGGVGAVARVAAALARDRRELRVPDVHRARGDARRDRARPHRPADRRVDRVPAVHAVAAAVGGVARPRRPRQRQHRRRPRTCTRRSPSTARAAASGSFSMPSRSALVGLVPSLFAFAIPLLVANTIVMAFILTNHSRSPRVEINDPLVSGLSVTAPRWVEWITLQLGYHVEHHLFPAMSSRHARTVRELLRARWPGRYPVDAAPPGARRGRVPRLQGRGERSSIRTRAASSRPRMPR